MPGCEWEPAKLYPGCIEERGSDGRGRATAFAASEPPPKPLSSREICTTSISGVSSIVRILYRLQLVLVTFPSGRLS
jgi:hypothetical protein